MNLQLEFRLDKREGRLLRLERNLVRQMMETIEAQDNLHRPNQHTRRTGIAAPNKNGGNVDGEFFPLTDLPTQIMAKICSYLPFGTIRRLRTMSWTLYYATNNPSLWTSVKLLGERLDAHILGLLLTGPTPRQLDITYGTIVGTEKEMKTLAHQLATKQ